MPSLVAFHRKCNIGSDDFVFPELTEASIRSTWVAFTISVFVFHFPLSCSAQNLNGFLFGILFINIFTILLAILTAGISARGTIMDSRPRKLIPVLLYFRLPVFVAEIVVTILATIQAFESTQGDGGCHFSTIVRVTIVLEWVLILTAIAGIFVVFHLGEKEVDDSTTIAERSWSRRMKIFKIGQDDSMRAALDEVALLISSFFIDIDLVFSDVVAGLLLVYHSPNNQYPPVREKQHQSSTIPSWMNLKDAEYYLHHATCVYGWPTYMLYNFRPTSFYRLFKSLQCCGTIREQSNVTHVQRTETIEEENDQLEMKCKNNKDVYKGQTVIVEDNCCYCNTAAVVLANEKKNLDLVFMSFRNRIYEVPFAVIADHYKRSIVITIRGSCSLTDLVTDLSLEDDVMTVDVDQDATLQKDDELDKKGDVRVHRGMLKSARYIFETVEKRNILENLFVVNEGYNLVVCGHSLGAGVGSLLAVLLKQQYPDVRCYAYAPPCVISEYGQDVMEKHVMSIVAGDDIISRISYQSMHRLREKICNELSLCQRAKFTILIRGFYQLFFKYPWDDEGLSGVRRTANSNQDTSLLENARNYGGVNVEEGDSLTTSNQITTKEKIQLYTPGKIMYVAETDTHLPILKWIDPKCLSDIKLSVAVFSDHMPARISKLMKSAIELSDNDIEIVTQQPC